MIKRITDFGPLTEAVAREAAVTGLIVVAIAGVWANVDKFETISRTGKTNRLEGAERIERLVTDLHRLAAPVIFILTGVKAVPKEDEEVS